MKDTTLSYIELRNIIGVVGVGLPVFLILGSGIFTGGQQFIQPSISHYYYSIMHVLFMWELIILGITLIVYKGNKAQKVVSTIAGFAAFGVAAFPTKIEEFKPNTDSSYICLNNPVTGSGNSVHFSFATILFICFAIFCFWLFQQPDEPLKTASEKVKKRRRNIVYHICGSVITACILSIAFFSFCASKYAAAHFPYHVIAFEIPALEAFGISWLVKGSANWKRYRVLRPVISPLR
ncbi:MAG: hypothetical protein JST47_06625 [Bacteroidetes bacterium]|nr:hypothetical protein [Bacteroidota bacterium]MBS1974584.1 hypothetical protein [Bacteroidota bacterium]